VNQADLGEPGREFHRLVKSDPPTLDDFRSGKELGRPLLNDRPETRLLWDGVSVYATEAQARRTARRYPQIGHYIAMLRVTQSSAVQWERTTQQDCHHTLWAEPEQIMRCVVAVVPVNW
jgi:hypothetical protein